MKIEEVQRELVEKIPYGTDASHQVATVLCSAIGKMVDIQHKYNRQQTESYEIITNLSIFLYDFKLKARDIINSGELTSDSKVEQLESLINDL